LEKRNQLFNKATYDLDKLKTLLRENPPVTTRRCRKEYTKLGYSDSAVLEVIKRLKKSEIYKTMPSEKKLELMQDVYKTVEGKDSLYIKLQENEAGDRCVFIQFKLE